MKNVNKLAVLISLAALLAPALKAKSPEQAYLARMLERSLDDGASLSA